MAIRVAKVGTAQERGNFKPTTLSGDNVMSATSFWSAAVSKTNRSNATLAVILRSPIVLPCCG
jgi:hypothetical protein